jgi:diamine N-acetyltransferase
LTVHTAINILKAGMQDLELLRETSMLAYAENFGHHWNEGGLEWYLEHEYGLEKIKSAICNPEVEYYLAFCNNEPAAFMKLNLNPELRLHINRQSMEIEKIYVRPQYHKRGIGQRLMELALQLAKNNHIDEIWLSVIDTNLSAIHFYRKSGFAFYNKIKLDLPHFKDELRGMWNMVLYL